MLTSFPVGTGSRNCTCEYGEEADARNENAGTRCANVPAHLSISISMYIAGIHTLFHDICSLGALIMFRIASTNPMRRCSFRLS
jgi:hypothetical protein